MDPRYTKCVGIVDFLIFGDYGISTRKSADPGQLDH